MATGKPPLGKHKGGSEAVRQSLLSLFHVLAALGHAALAMAGRAVDLGRRAGDIRLPWHLFEVCLARSRL